MGCAGSGASSILRNSADTERPYTESTPFSTGKRGLFSAIRLRKRLQHGECCCIMKKIVSSIGIAKLSCTANCRGGYHPPAQHNPPTKCRGGSQPPAQYKPTIMNPVGRIRTMLDKSSIHPNTQLTYPPLQWLGGFGTRYHLTEPLNPVRLREATSLPYSGWWRNDYFTISF